MVKLFGKLFYYKLSAGLELQINLLQFGVEITSVTLLNACFFTAKFKYSNTSRNGS